VFERINERIVIVKLGALGDVLRTTMCLEPLKRRFPGSHITWVTRENARSLLDGNPWIDRILCVEHNYLELLLTERFDVAIGPDTDPVSSAIMALVRANVKHGFAADERGGVIPLSDVAREWWLMGIDDARKQANRRTYGELLYAMCDLVAPIVRPRFDLSHDVTARATQRLRNARPRRTSWVGFNTGAGERWAEKRWKPAYFVRLAELVETAHPECAIVLMGGPEQQWLNEQLIDAHPTFIDGGTANTMPEFAGLIAACDWILTADSLGYHVASAVRTPAMCLVGPTSPWELDAFDTNCVLHAALECIACYRAHCPFDSTCMDLLSPEIVWDRVREWRGESRGPRITPPRVNIVQPELVTAASIARRVFETIRACANGSPPSSDRPNPDGERNREWSRLLLAGCERSTQVLPTRAQG
jgi:heptosyltransferase-2